LDSFGGLRSAQVKRKAARKLAGYMLKQFLQEWKPLIDQAVSKPFLGGKGASRNLVFTLDVNK
jgi:hypothetical protein